MSFDEDDPFADGYDDMDDDPFNTTYGEDGMMSMDGEEDDDDEEKEACFDLEALTEIGTEMKTVSGNKYWSRDPNEVMRWAQKMASQLAEHLDLTYSQTWALLDRYDYNASKVLTKYEQDFDELQKVLEEANVAEDAYDDDTDGTTKEDDDTLLECPVCYEDKPKKDFISRSELRCGHTNICKTCFGDYIVKSAKDKKGRFFDKLSVLNMKCPMSKCTCPLTMETIERYAPPDLIKKRNLWISEAIALKSSNLTSCIKCDRTFEFNKTKDEVKKMPLETGELACLCGHVQCWLCNDEGHSPCRCIEVKDWAELSNEDKMLENLKKQCKQCPKCGMGAYISDKNACNHMTCPCGHHWCWMCLKPWSTHGSDYYGCKFYSKDKEAQKMNQERDQELADLKRLQEYENRIAPLISASSGPASKSLLKTKKELQKKFETYCGYTEKQTQFLDEAAITVMQMKRMLKYCNIYLYFRPNSVEDRERQLFEQQMMQMTFTCDTLHVLVDPDEKNNAHEYGLLNRMMGLSSTDDKSSERTKKRAKVAKLERRSSQELKYHIKYEKVDPSDHKQRKELFDKYKKLVKNLSTEVRKFGERVTQAAAKGKLNVDEKERHKNMVRTARARLKLVTWQFKKKGSWIEFDSEAAFSLELGRMAGNVEFTIFSSKFSKKPIHIDLAKMILTENDKDTTKIQRNVKSLGLKKDDTWECSRCKKRTSKDNNACVFCGAVRGH